MKDCQTRFCSTCPHRTAPDLILRAAVFVCIIGLGALPARAATPQQIDAAIKKGVNYIYSKEKPDGRWETEGRRLGMEHNDWQAMQGDAWGGFSSLSTYALLAAGESPKDKRVVNAINFLKNADIIGIYALGLRAQVWHLLADTPAKQAELKKFVDADAERIIAGLNTSGDSRGLWDYGNGKGPRIDHSVSQYGILGLWALQDAGARIDVRYWKTFDQVWRDQQLNDGGWAYNTTRTIKGDQPDPRPSMTAAGIATLFITQDNTFDELEHHGNVFNANIENGLRWITKHFNEVDNNYTWYGIERIGVASGTKYFGTTDWFEKGADRLVAEQGAEGQWTSKGLGTDLTDTCFAVLFLARGRAPIMLNKLQYEVSDKAGKPAETDWNERPRDAANLTKWTGDQIETNLNWQLVNLQVAPEALRDAPIIYIAGDQELRLSEADEEKLKTIVHEGGMILGNADFNSQPFSESFMKLGTKLFGYEFRELEPNSPILNEEAHLKRTRVKVLALSNGIREMMILLHQGDAGRSWQKPPTLANNDAQALGANIFLYAVDKKNLVTRGETTVVMPNPQIKNSHVVRVARLKYGGNWDPEPGGWPRLAAILHNNFRTDLDINTIDLSSTALTAGPEEAPVPRPSADEIHTQAFKSIPADQVLATEGNQAKLNALLQPRIKAIEADIAAKEAARLAAMAPYKIAALTGTTQFNLTDAQTAQLKKFIGVGGTLIIDSGGGSAQFTASAEALLKTLLPDMTEDTFLHPLTLEDPLYVLPAAPIKDIEYRNFARTVLSSAHMPRVLGLRHNGRVAVYFSREDLSGGLVGQPTDGIVGYTPAIATAIVRNVILLTVPPPPPPATAPATAPAKK